MNPTDVKVEEVLDKHDEDLNPIEEPKEDPKEGAENEVKPTDGDTNPDDGTRSPSDEEAGFTAEELEQSEEPTEEENKPAQVQNVDPELKYIADNLPDITVRILQDGKPVSVSVKSWTQLPENVEFASPRDQLQFMNAMVAQENRAQQLQGKYRQDQETQLQSDFEARENAAIRSDITKLQNEGNLPKFKVGPDDSGFADDPNTKEVQTVLDFMNKKNQEYLEGYNNGRAYKHIGFEEAYYMMPETRQKEAQKLAQKQEDDARAKNANKLGNSSGGQPPQKTQGVRRGMSLDEIVDRVEREW